MKTYTITLTDPEVEVILKTLDSAQTRGIETQRVVVALADKLLAARESTAPVQLPTPVAAPFAPPHAVPTEEVA